ncbi:hypothetical protein M408DRAFT_19892, partial [Serendipita vermifera MAFF 305830]
MAPLPPPLPWSLYRVRNFSNCHLATPLFLSIAFNSVLEHDNPSTTRMLVDIGFRSPVRLVHSRVPGGTQILHYKVGPLRLASLPRRMGSSPNQNLDELLAQHLSVEKVLLNAAPESISTSDAISFHLNSGYLEQLRMTEGVRGHLLNQSVSPLERIQAAAIFASKSQECTSLPLDSTIWSRFVPIQDLFLEAALAPESFLKNLPTYAKSGLVSISSEKNQQDDGLFQYYYTRILDIEPE